MLDVLAQLPLRIEDSSIERLARRGATGGIRRTTLVRLRGDGHEGQGEDVTFQTADALTTASGLAALCDVRTLGDAWCRLERLQLFPRPPEHAVVRSYRRWAVEAAALDLALRLAGLTLAEHIGRVPGPVRFVLSPAGSRIPHLPGARLKLDAAYIEPGLPVDIVDFKGTGDVRLVERLGGKFIDDTTIVQAWSARWAASWGTSGIAQPCSRTTDTRPMSFVPM